jgi:hypothetical protein
MQRLNKQTWAEIRRLFVAGWSIRRLAKRFGISQGTIAPRAAREHWARERIEGQTMDRNETIISDDPELAAVQQIVRDCKLAALTAEAKTAQVLALKALKAVEALELTTMEDITAAQAYRSALWPSVAPSIAPALEAARRGKRLVVSEETKKYVASLKALM